MKLSVVIPTLNEEGYIGMLLRDLDRQRRRPDEVIVVDGRSGDRTGSVVESSPGARLLSCSPPVSNQRNLGGMKAGGDVLVFLDADVRLGEAFFEEFLRRFEDRRLDAACPLYLPQPGSSVPVNAIHVFFNSVFVALQKILPSGSGQCIAVSREAFLKSEGFDTTLKFADDMELIRRLSRDHRFGIITSKVFVSDRRFRRDGVARTVAKLLLMSFLFTIGRFDWSNRIEYEFGNYDRYRRRFSWGLKKWGR